VDWTVEGTRPLAGRYHSKADFLALEDWQGFRQGEQLRVQNVLLSDNRAVVELPKPLWRTAENVLRFDTGIAGFADLKRARSQRSESTSIQRSSPG